METTSIIATIKLITDGFKALRRVLEQVRSAEATQWLTELQGEFIVVQQAVMDLVNEKAELQVKIQQLEEKLNLREDMSLDRKYGVFWQNTESERAGPYCPQCWGLHNKAVLLENVGTDSSGITWRCVHHTIPFVIVMPQSETPDAHRHSNPYSEAALDFYGEEDAL